MPSEFQIDAVAYRTRRLSAAHQHALLRTLEPVRPALSRLDLGLRLPGLDLRAIVTLFAPLRDLGDDAMDAVFAGCLAAVERVDGASVGSPGVAALFSIAMNVVAANFGPLFTMKRPRFEPCPTGASDRGYGDLGPVALPDDLDQLYAPAVAGLCRYTDLHDGTLQIEDVFRMNDILSVRDENQARLRYAAEQG